MNSEPMAAVDECEICKDKQWDRISKILDEEFPDYPYDRPTIDRRADRTQELWRREEKPCVQFYTCEEQVSICVECLQKLVEVAKQL